MTKNPESFSEQIEEATQLQREQRLEQESRAEKMNTATWTGPTAPKGNDKYLPLDT